jgi:hypothetical protein
METATKGGLAEMALKKEYGARFGTPLPDFVEIQPIGRGTIRDVRRRYRSWRERRRGSTGFSGVFSMWAGPSEPVISLWESG